MKNPNRLYYTKDNTITFIGFSESHNIKLHTNIFSRTLIYSWPDPSITIPINIQQIAWEEHDNFKKHRWKLL